MTVDITFDDTIETVRLMLRVIHEFKSESAKLAPP